MELEVDNSGKGESKFNKLARKILLGKCHSRNLMEEILLKAL